MPITQASYIKLNKPKEMEAIIGHPPGWTLRWGTTVLFVAILVLIGISWFVSYPDVIEANTIITTENPPIRLVAGTSAKIASFQVENGEQVQKGQLLGSLENPTNQKDIQTIESLVEGLIANEAPAYLSVNIPENLNLGSLHSAYAALSKSLEDLKFYLSQDANYLKINNLRAQIAEILKIEESLNRQAAIFTQELGIYQSQVSRDSLLLSQNSLSVLEFEKTKSNYLAMQRQRESLLAGSANNRLEIQQLEAQIIDLQQNQNESQSERVLALNEVLQKTKGAIKEWKEKWLLIAPIDGEVVFTNAWSEQQFVHENTEILTIVPEENAGKLMAKAILAGPNAGKVKTEMKVYIRLEGFPYQEFGQLNGTVGNIAPVPNANGYECNIDLPNGLTTSYSKEIPFRQEMKGTARIVSEDRTLLMRIMEKIHAAMEE